MGKKLNLIINCCEECPYYGYDHRVDVNCCNHKGFKNRSTYPSSNLLFYDEIKNRVHEECPLEDNE